MTAVPTPEQWARMSWHARQRCQRRLRSEGVTVDLAPLAGRPKPRIRRRPDGWWELVDGDNRVMAARAQVLWRLVGDVGRGSA